MARFIKGKRVNNQISGAEFSKFVDEEKAKIIKEKVAIVKRIAPQKAIETRKKITKAWFGGASDSSNAFQGAMDSRIAYTRFNNKNEVTIHISTWVNLNRLYELSNHDSLDRWVVRHKSFGELDWEYTEPEWILHLPWDEGIIGLPKYANTYEYIFHQKYNGNGWKNGRNLNFLKRETSLKHASKSSSLWKSYFEDEINKALKNI